MSEIYLLDIAAKISYDNGVIRSFKPQGDIK